MDVKATSVAGKELAVMDLTTKEKVTANLQGNLQKKVNKVCEIRKQTDIIGPVVFHPNPCT
jgi:hypothetical protein